jgi:hypothetical protein
VGVDAGGPEGVDDQIRRHFGRRSLEETLLLGGGLRRGRRPRGRGRRRRRGDHYFAQRRQVDHRPSGRRRDARQTKITH